VSEIPVDKPIVAAFDFDGTLTHRDTMFPFLLHVVGWRAFVRHLFVLAPTLVAYGLGLIRNDITKEQVFIRFLSGINIDVLREKSEQFATIVMPKLIRTEAMKRFEWHKQQGHLCIVISASLEIYLKPWVLKVGFNDVIATQLETLQDGNITGKLSGSNCFGVEKVRRLEAMLGSKQGYTLYAYGDSRGDKELLSFADIAYYRFILN
jgi:HAD superfamily hydrolase (TIGR01490 family)